MLSSLCSPSPPPLLSRARAQWAGPLAGAEASGAEGAGSLVGGKEQSHRLRRTRRFRFRTTAFS
eukprot:471340-Rhodomonas_salina.1